ncbi:hypothetical protein DUNSADRAFT_18163 [Dunaliella salina]|uniref:Encoded protein n=1 Tax=Dunaliella salina TaxID=3046 RepID=A0ABQ7G0K7_DUNSA|nr:hypothetical protein DUNSADRAFT_18163 [Dunaliella salina]|eukprot:KAF5828133.1 hypothetical protein DUNSADRAFT_18163 [Dunaliella salina]
MGFWCRDDAPHIFPDINPPPHHRISPGSPISVVKLHKFRLLDKLTSLELSECSLVVLPPNVAALPALQHINLENNALTGLPPQVAFAHSLRSAQLAHNRLPALPQCLLEDAKGLETLTVSSGVIAGTPLHVLDDVFLQLPNLVQLSVKGNKFESRAVHNLLRLSKRITQAGALLHIDVTPSE